MLSTLENKLLKCCQSTFSLLYSHQFPPGVSPDLLYSVETVGIRRNCPNISDVVLYRVGGMEEVLAVEQDTR